jgi:hypothetical protein
MIDIGKILDVINGKRFKIIDIIFGKMKKNLINKEKK